jgi:mRNA interferase ChpB
MSRIPDRGEIWHITFDPASGTEMKEKHFCLVLSKKGFNDKFGLTMVCPISGGNSAIARSQGFLVTLMGLGTTTSGNIHCHQVKMLDLRSRGGKYIETIDNPNVIQDILDRVGVILQ